MISSSVKWHLVPRVTIATIPLHKYYPAQNINRTHEKVKEREEHPKPQTVGDPICRDPGCWHNRWELGKVKTLNAVTFKIKFKVHLNIERTEVIRTLMTISLYI